MKNQSRLRKVNLYLFILMSLLGAEVRAAELATIVGRPDFNLDFVQSLVKMSFPLLGPEDSSYERDLSTAVYSILAREGISRAYSVEVLSQQGASLSQLMSALHLSASKEVPVVLNLLRGSVGSNDLMCRTMADFPDVVFLLGAGSDGNGGAIDSNREPHCFSKNILVVASLDQNKGTLAPFSNFGKGVRLAASGVNIPVVLAEGRKAKWSGISIPLSFVGAKSALHAGENPSLKGAELIEHFLLNKTTVLPSLQEKVEGNRVVFGKLQ